MRKILSLILCLVICFSCSSPAFADYSNNFEQLGLWDLIVLAGSNLAPNVYGVDKMVQSVAGLLSGQVCGTSDDKYHHCDTLDGCKTGKDDNGYYAIAKCKYCGESFKVYSSDVKSAYKGGGFGGGTSSGGGGGRRFSKYDSDGHYYWQPTINDVTYIAINFKDGWKQLQLPLPYTLQPFLYSPRSNGIHIGFISDYSSFYNASFAFWSCRFNVPYNGLYRQTGSLHSTGSYYDSSGISHSFVLNYPDVPSFSTYAKGKTIYTSIGSSYSYYNGLYASADLYFPIYEYIPTDSISGYTPDSRISSLPLNYGIIGDNGQIIQNQTNSIVNENNKTFTNPVTNNTSNITNWTYDYSNCTYNVTLDSGDTVTITYGDENVTINQGDTIYNVYYIYNTGVSGGGTGGDSSTTCKHDYTSEVTTAATCEAPGLRTYTCSKCSKTYTEKIPATGHTWQVKQTINTEYDDAGNVTQQGYTIYKCSVCSTEYKDDSGAGPPSKPSGGDSADGDSIWTKLGNLIGSLTSGLADVIIAIVGAVLDALTKLAETIGNGFTTIVEMILGWFESIPDLFSGFLGLLTALFPFLPDDIMLLLSFGVAAIVFIGILKAIRR